MKKIFFLIITCLLLLSCECKHYYNVKIVPINENLYVKGIENRLHYGSARFATHYYRLYYVGPLMNNDTVFIIKGELIEKGVNAPLEYNLGDKIILKK